MTPPSVPIGMPCRLIAGDTIVWDDASFSDERGTFTAADGYVLTYYLASPWAKAQAIVAVVTNGNWRTTVPVATTAKLAGSCAEPSTVTWYARVAKAGEEFTVAKGTVPLEPNLATAGPITDPLDAELAEVEAAIRKSRGITSYQFGSRGVTRDLQSLYKRRAVLLQAKARRANGGVLPTRLVTFNPVTG